MPTKKLQLVKMHTQNIIDGGEHKIAQRKDTSRRVSASETFQAQRRRLYEEARGSMKILAAASIQLLEQTRAQILDLKSQEVGMDNFLADYALRCTGQDDAYMQWQKNAGVFLNKLGQERSGVVDNASGILNQATTERKIALDEFSRNARLRVEQSRQQEKLATDASALIKYYKDLLIKIS